MTKVRSQQQVIEAAAKVFTEKGYQAARVEDIAAELGILQGSVYYHVGSKAGLLRLVQRSRFEEIIAELESIAESTLSPHDKLKRSIRAQLRYIVRYLPESPQWFTNPFDPRKTDAETEEDRLMLRRYRGIWKTIVREGIKAGAIGKRVDPSVTVLSILGMTNYVARWYDVDSKKSIDQIANSQFDLIWSGIAAPPA
jgi:TetR/AcrR family transcriptional regulator, cholesterol catabolism regulator